MHSTDSLSFVRWIVCLYEKNKLLLLVGFSCGSCTHFYLNLKIGKKKERKRRKEKQYSPSLSLSCLLCFTCGPLIGICKEVTAGGAHREEKRKMSTVQITWSIPALFLFLFYDGGTNLNSITFSDLRKPLLLLLGNDPLEGLAHVLSVEREIASLKSAVLPPTPFFFLSFL